MLNSTHLLAVSKGGSPPTANPNHAGINDTIPPALRLNPHSGNVTAQRRRNPDVGGHLGVDPGPSLVGAELEDPLPKLDLSVLIVRSVHPVHQKVSKSYHHLL